MRRAAVRSCSTARWACACCVIPARSPKNGSRVIWLPISREPARAGSLEIGSQITLEPFFGERAGMTQQAQAHRAVEHDRTAARRIARHAGERGRNGATNDLVRAQLLGAAEAALERYRGQNRCNDRAAGPPYHPNTSAVMDVNQASASRASRTRSSGGASTGLIPPPPSISL